MRRWSLALLLGVACGATPPVRTALQGNLADLKQDIANAERAGKLDHGAVVALAHAVAARELTSAEGPSGAERVRRLRGCARPLRGAIEQRAQKEDDVAAELTSILVEMHVVDRPALVSRHARSPSGAFRAVSARAAQRPIDTDLRRAFFSDPDPRVRRAVFTTAREAKEPGELELLLEAARSDPDPQSRSLAVGAAGAIGGERAVLSLKDLWARADDTLRMAIVDGWAEPASLAAGGARELSVAAESGGGLAQVSASSALARVPGPEAAAADARLCRFILSGSDDEKRLALGLADGSAETEAAVVQAAREASPELQVIALGRLIAVPARRAEALRTLRERASQKTDSVPARNARAAAVRVLADSGDTSVEGTLVEGLRDQSPQVRASSARGLANLDAYSKVAPALADDDRDVRADLACTILARENTRR